MNTRRRVLSACALLASLAGLASAPAPAAETFGGEAYTLETCPVSGEKFGKDAVTVVLTGMKDKNLDGTQMKFCCPKCEAAFKTDPAKYMTAVNEKLIAAAGNYPISTCLVMTDESIDESSKTVVYHNRVYRLCCKKCVARFEKDPSKYEKAFESAVIAKQKSAYKATKCPISGEAIDAKATDVVIAGRLVRTCCPKCADKAKSDPKATLAKVDAEIASAGGTGTRSNESIEVEPK